MFRARILAMRIYLVAREMVDICGTFMGIFKYILLFYSLVSVGLISSPRSIFSCNLAMARHIIGVVWNLRPQISGISKVYSVVM